MEVSGFDSHFDFLACLSAWHGNFDVASQLDRKYPAVHETESACLGCWKEKRHVLQSPDIRSRLNQPDNRQSVFAIKKYSRLGP